MNYAILHNKTLERVVEVPNMDFVPMLIDYALENEAELVIFVPEFKEYRKLEHSDWTINCFRITKDK
jgi:hypothetical protein